VSFHLHRFKKGNQECKEKYLYDPESQTFQGVPNRVNDLLKKPEVQKGIDKAKKYLGES